MFLFLTLWLNCSSIFGLHPLYLAVANMDVDAQKGSIVLSIRLFTDDLETVLHNKYNIDGWIGTPREHRDGRRLLKDYLNERFSIVVNNNEKIILVTDSMTINDDAMWFYLKGVAQQPIKRVEIDNRILTDFFSNQINLVIINSNKNENGYKLNRKNHKIDLNL